MVPQRSVRQRWEFRPRWRDLAKGTSGFARVRSDNAAFATRRPGIVARYAGNLIIFQCGRPQAQLCFLGCEVEAMYPLEELLESAVAARS